VTHFLWVLLVLNVAFTVIDHIVGKYSSNQTVEIVPIPIPKNNVYEGTV
jgi:hypothetical protein